MMDDNTITQETVDEIMGRLAKAEMGFYSSNWQTSAIWAALNKLDYRKLLPHRKENPDA